MPKKSYDHISEVTNQPYFHTIIGHLPMLVATLSVTENAQQSSLRSGCIRRPLCISGSHFEAICQAIPGQNNWGLDWNGCKLDDKLPAQQGVYISMQIKGRMLNFEHCAISNNPDQPN